MTNENCIKVLKEMQVCEVIECDDSCAFYDKREKICERDIALDMAINALEIVSDFETANIITGGRLNGRTHAYKCGLADGQRLAKGEKLFNILPLEQNVEEEGDGK